MKKTTLFLLATCALAGCYSAPEMVENKYRGYYSDSTVCGASTDYQHEELRACIERRLKEEDKNKKTVSIIPLENGSSLVVPKVPGDDVLKDTSLIYEVVDVREKAAVQDDYDEEAERIEVQQLMAAKTTSPTVEENGSEAEENAEDKEEVQELDDETGAFIVETIVADQNPNPVTEDKETAVGVETRTVAEGVTLVMGPLKEDLIVEVRTAGKNASGVDVKKTTITKISATDEKETDTDAALDNIEEWDIFEKNTKEVLPLEEK